MSQRYNILVVPAGGREAWLWGGGGPPRPKAGDWAWVQKNLAELTSIFDPEEYMFLPIEAEDD